MKVTRKYGYAEYYARCTCRYLTDSCGNCRFRRDNPPPPMPIWFAVFVFLFGVFLILYFQEISKPLPPPSPYVEHDEIYDGVNNYTDQVCE